VALKGGILFGIWPFGTLLYFKTLMGDILIGKEISGRERWLSLWGEGFDLEKKVV